MIYDNEPDFVADHADVVTWAKLMLTLTDWVILDTETSGLDGNAEICQIAIIDHTGATLLDTLVKPTLPIPAAASRIHGITDATVQDAPLWADVREQVQQIVAGKIVLIYNAEYDTRLMRQSDRMAVQGTVVPDFKALAIESLCVMDRYSTYVGDWNDWRGGYRWQKLPGGNHSARGDCLACLEVLKRMAESADA